MHERVKKLEQQVSGLVTDVAVIKSNYATRQDVDALRLELHTALSETTRALTEQNNQTRWELHRAVLDINKTMTEQYTLLSEQNSQTRTDLHKSVAELHKAMSSQTRWLFTAMFVVLGAGLSIAKLIF